MKQRNKNAFTLIELVAILVIMAIIALIATPLVMNIIRSARVAADKRSVDAYGRSIELAVAGYLLDNGRFPTQVSELTIEYSGNEVVCETTQLNTDSSVYLAGCTVAGRSTGDYTYGIDKLPKSYKIGDRIIYNGVDYYVIKDSASSESMVTLLKMVPLTVAEVNQYGGVGTENNHVNMYVTPNTSADYYQTARDYNYDGTIGGMAYYSSATCNGFGDVSGCTTNYAQSEIKHVVDAWKNAQASLAIDARLISLDDLVDNLGIELKRIAPTDYKITVTEDTPVWIMGENYWYWSMTTNTDMTADVWTVGPYSYAHLDSRGVQIYYDYAIRPVIVLPKSAID